MSRSMSSLGETNGTSGEQSTRQNRGEVQTSPYSLTDLVQYWLVKKQKQTRYQELHEEIVEQNFERQIIHSEEKLPNRRLD